MPVMDWLFDDSHMRAELYQRSTGSNPPVEIQQEHVERELPDNQRRQVVEQAKRCDQPVKMALPAGVPR
jgi:hypothetical protein